MNICHVLLLLALCCGLAHGAQVYMEFNGHKYAYNTDKDALGGHALSPNYDYQDQQYLTSLPSSPTTAAVAATAAVPGYSPHQFVQQSWSNMRRHPNTMEIPYQHQQPHQEHLSHARQTGPNFDFSTHQMSHSQHTDQAGHIVGKYSYYDAAGYHELSYKAGAGIGFVVMGGNLAKATEQPSQLTEIQSNDLSSATNFGHLHQRFFRK
ncbi:uncharacterized protein Dwil_GK19275 [Drosophila willistoni]|uniref:Uncharacterized protein n=1 Tax=Drosophila willistoni TaxID=7260 RepID=B4MKK7_DROWI|nr:uncharacterized protein Dwil_GK19275 [Drosophila willistoni]